MESRVTQERSEKNDNTTKAKNAAKPTKTTQSQSYTGRKKSEKQVNTILKSLTTTGMVASCCQRLNIKLVSSEIAAQLAQDTEHRMRELIELAKQFMLHSNRTRLLLDDITQACIHSNAEIDTPPFSVTFQSSTQELDIDLEDVVMKEERCNTAKEGTVGCSWLVLEGNVLDNKKNRGMQVTTSVSARMGKHRDNLHLFISSIFSEDSETRELSLSQLATAAWINSILVELIHTLCDVMKCESAGRERLLALEAVKCICGNKKIFIEPYLILLVSSLKSLLFIDKPTHYRAKRELLQRNALTGLLCLLREHTTPFNGLEGQLEREASRLINSIKTHPVNLYGALLVAFDVESSLLEGCVIPKLDVIFENCIRSLERKHTHFSHYLSLLIIYQLSYSVALYLSTATDATNSLQLYTSSVDKFGEIFMIQSLSYQFRAPYLKVVAKKKQSQVYIGEGKMDERDLEKLMYLTNLPTPEAASPYPKSSQKMETDVSPFVFKEGDKIQFTIQSTQTQVLRTMDIEDTILNFSKINTNFKTRIIKQPALDINCDLRTFF